MSSHRRGSSVASIGSRPGSRMDDKPKLALSHILVHRCEFKMPKNPKYSCPRNGEMFDPLFAIWYCLIHDRDAQRRCQAFSDFQGIRCPELGDCNDEETGRRYCVRHFKDGKSHIEMPGVHRMEAVARAQTPVAKKFERKKTGRATPTPVERTRRMSVDAVPVANRTEVIRTKRLSVPYIPPVKRVETAPPPRRVRDTPTPTRTRTPMHRRQLSEPTSTTKPKPIVKPVQKPVPKPEPPKPAAPRLKRKPRISNVAATISQKASPPEPERIPTPAVPASPVQKVPTPEPPIKAPPPPPRILTPAAAAIPLPPSPEPERLDSKVPTPLPTPPPVEDVFVASPVSPKLDRWPSTASTQVPSPSPSPSLPPASPAKEPEILPTSPSPELKRWTPPTSSPLPSPLQIPIEEDVLKKARARLSTFRSHTPTSPASPASTEPSPFASPAFHHSPHTSPMDDDMPRKPWARLSSYQFPSPVSPSSPGPDRWASTSSPSPQRWGSVSSSPFHTPLPPPSPFEADTLRNARNRLSSSHFPLPSPTPPPLPPSPYEPSTLRRTQPRPRPSPLQMPSLTPTSPSLSNTSKPPPNRLPAFQFPQPPSSPAPRSPSTPTLNSTTPKHHHPSLRSISHVLSRFMHNIENREEDERTKVAAMYQECTICLESHNASMMKKVEECGHQYRELCLSKVLRTGNSRNYNCVGCRAWMGRLMEQREGKQELRG